jgi:heme-degrading monooxygenase HmoA
MPYLLVRHKIEHFPHWKTIFDEHAATRKASGSKGGDLFRIAHDPNEVVVLLEFETAEQARQFAQSEDLREKMKHARVAEEPNFYILENVEHLSA